VTPPGPLDLRDAAVDEARVRATEMPRSLTDVERRELLWTRRHPEGRSELTELAAVLWNFGVGKATLKAEHQDALEGFLAPWLVSPIPAAVEITVTGYASPTGTEQTNTTIAQQRAEAVARLLRIVGFNDVTSTGGGVAPANQEDGEALARARRVVVEVPALPRPPVPPPTWPVAPLPQPERSPQLPSWFPSGAGRITLNTPPIPIQIVPGYPVLEGQMSIVGDATLRYGDPQALNTLMGIYNAGENRVQVQLAAPLSDTISTKLQVDLPSAGRPQLGLRWTAQFNEVFAKPELGFQLGENPIFLALSFNELPWSVDLFGGRLDFVFRGRARFDLRPGPVLVLEVAPFIARTVTVVAESVVAGTEAAAGAVAAAAAPVVVAVGVVGVALAWSAGVAAECVYAREAGLARARLVTARVAYAAPLATVTVGTDGARAQLGDLLRTLRMARGESPVADVVTAYANQAGDAFTALSDTDQAAAIARWRARYGVTSTGTPDLEFNAVRERMSLALGGVSARGSASFQLSDL
jgi:outer membrane protein OmpA-like peptidoglycan-associated protein